MNDISIKVTNLGKENGYGIRLFMKNGLLHSEERVKTRLEVGEKIKEMLRWYDKCGGDSDMAYASRERFYCGGKNK